MAQELSNLGIIPDGNRRFASQLGKEPSQGHKLGAQKMRQVLQWLSELGIETGTIYLLSWENLNKRPEQEFKFLMSMFEREAQRAVEDDRTHEEEVRFNVIGRYRRLPDNVVKALDELQEKTQNYDNYKVNLAIAYGGRQEIVDAVRSLYNNGGENITADKLEDYLYTSDRPDMILRTGKEKRLSNFLLWQSAYSELYFVDKYWPEVEKQDFADAVEEFNRRERRMGE